MFNPISTASFNLRFISIEMWYQNACTLLYMWCTLVTRKCKTISQIIPFYIISLNTFFFTKYRKQYKNYLGIYIQVNVLVHWPSFVLNNACICAPTRILKELTLLTVSWIEIFSSNVRLRHPVRLVYAFQHADLQIFSIS